MPISDPFANRYSNLRLVGRGGFGSVYRAWDAELEIDVALKILKPELAEAPDWRKRFRQEATAASKLNSHRNITIILDRNEFEGQPFIVMEFVEGETLARIIEKGVPFSDPERIKLLEQLCSGLNYAHKRGIVHRDIKPVNLMVREDQDAYEARTLKILDFGIAKVLNTGQTATGSFAFTPSYVSPEQILGLDVDQRSDIFAVGAVAYELITSQRAFPISATDPFQVMSEVSRKIVENPHKPLADWRPDIDSEMGRIINRALAKSPADRYPDLLEMGARLRKLRERMEEAAEAVGSQTTIVLSATTQEALKAARHLGDAGDFTAAVRRLEDASAAAPGRERRFLERALVEMRERLAARQAERKAHDDEAARAAVKIASTSFAEGERTAALKVLTDFDPAALVAAQLAQLQNASRLVDAAEAALARGDRNSRDAALAALDAFEPRDLVAGVARRLRAEAQRRQKQEEEARIAEEEARRKQEEEARRIAEEEARRKQEAEARRVAEEEARRKQEAEARRIAEEEARRKQEAEARRIAEEEARLKQEAEAGRITGEEARRKQEAESQRKKEEKAKRAAKREADRAADAAARRTIDAARASFMSGNREDAIASLEAADPERVGAALDALRTAAAVIRSATATVESAGPDARVAALERLARFPDKAIISEGLERLRERHEQRLASEREQEKAARHARAAAAIAQAEAQFAAGEVQPALASLQAFAQPALVEDALGRLRELAALVERVEIEVQTGAPAARQDALGQLAQTDPRFAGSALQRLRARDQERTAEEKRREDERLAKERRLEDERKKREADEKAREEEARRRKELEEQAADLIRRARAVFADGKIADAQRMLEGFAARNLVDKEQLALASAALAIKSARKTVTTPATSAAERQKEIEQLNAREPRELFAHALDELQGVHARRLEEERKRTEEAERQAALERERRRRVNEALAEARRLPAAQGLALLERFRPEDAAIDELKESLRVDLRVAETLDRAEGQLDAGNLDEAMREVTDARGLRPADADVELLYRRVVERRRAQRIAQLQRAATRIGAPAALVFALAAGGYELWKNLPAGYFGGTQPPTTTSSSTATTSIPVAPVPTAVSIDAVPWARFTITSLAGDSKQATVTGETPAVVQLLPGQYKVQLENGQLTEPHEETITVGTTPIQKTIQMPGFSPDRVVTSLIGSNR